MNEFLHELMSDRFNLSVFALLLCFFGYLTYRLLLAFPLRMILEKVRIFFRHPELMYGEERHSPSRNHQAAVQQDFQAYGEADPANPTENPRGDGSRPRRRSMVRKAPKAQAKKTA